MDNNIDFQLMILQAIEYINHLADPVCLHLSQFYSHEQVPLPIDSSRLAGMTQATRTYAKALRFKEQEFIANFDTMGILNGKV